jgi:hypothetical protein
VKEANLFVKSKRKRKKDEPDNSELKTLEPKIEQLKN